MKSAKDSQAMSHKVAHLAFSSNLQRKKLTKKTSNLSAVVFIFKLTFLYSLKRESSLVSFGLFSTMISARMK